MGLLWQRRTPKRHHDPAVVEGKPGWHGMSHIPGHASQKNSYRYAASTTEAGAAQPALSPPRPTNTANCQQLASSVQWSWRQIPYTIRQYIELVQELGRQVTTYYRLPVPAVIISVKKRSELTRSRSEHVHSQLACCKPVVCFFSFNVYCVRLAIWPLTRNITYIYT